MKKNVWVVIILLVAVVLVLISRNSPERRERPEPEKTLPTEEKGTPVTLYFPNLEYIRTGNEELPRLLPVEREIKSENGEFEERVLQELRQPPPDEEEMTSGIRENLTIIDVRREGELVYVNFSSENLYGGSLEERLLIEQVTRTLTGLAGVEGVQFLVDGEKRESLMGHIGTERPLGREDLLPAPST